MVILVAALFLIVFLTILGCVGLGLSYLRSKQKQQIRLMLRNAEATPAERRSELVRPAEHEDKLGELLRRFQFMERLNLVLLQAGQNWTGTKLLTISLVACFAGLMIGSRVRALPPQLAACAGGALGAVIPILIVLRKRRKTLAAFEEQFPEALDFLSRSMRAGHGFSVALEMLGADSPEPLGPAFRHVSNDLQLGSSLEAALGKLMLTIPLLDVRFFVSSVLLQQETGGNLGEILSKLANIIRERFRLKGQVKAASAHGRITGLVLLLMPVGVALFMMFSSPDYLRQLAADKTGRTMLYGAIGGQVIGYFVIKKIVNIKV